MIPARYGLQARPAAVVALPPPRGTQSVRFLMPRSVRFSAAIDSPEALTASSAFRAACRSSIQGDAHRPRPRPRVTGASSVPLPSARAQCEREGAPRKGFLRRPQRPPPRVNRVCSLVAEQIDQVLVRWTSNNTRVR